MEVKSASLLIPRGLDWAALVFVCLVQLVFTSHSRHELRYEELAESVRNVYWLEHRTIYDGISSNVGWYGTLLLVYKAFGFDLNTAKFVRFALACISLLAVARVLRRFFDARRAALLLVAVGLSPTLLYFNTLQTSYGIDLQYAPIVLYLVLTASFRASWAAAGSQLLLGSVSMIACMSYPTFLFYLPTLALLYGRRVLREPVQASFAAIGRNILLAALGFVLPLALAAIYVRDRWLLWFDPAVNSGMFRGAGYLSIDPNNFVSNASHTVRDLFYRAGSYYFEIPVSEFSGYYPLLAVACVLAAGAVLTIRVRGQRLAFFSVWALLLFAGLGAHVGLDPSGTSGLRRSTPILAGIYALAAVGWYQARWQEPWGRALARVLAVSVSLVAVHHVLALPRNYTHLGTRSERFGTPSFFTSAGTPSQSLAALVAQAQSTDVELRCGNWADPCRLAEVYAAVAGSCLWNDLSCHPIRGYDERTDRFIPLRIELWKSDYLPH